MAWQSLTALSTLSALIFLCLMVWVWLIDDPHGGEPMMIIPLSSTIASDLDPSEIDVIGVRPSITPNPPFAQIAEAPSGQADTSSISDPVEQASLAPTPHSELRNRFDAEQGLAPARLTVFPSETLVERTPSGLIPRRGGGGSSAFRFYARPVDFVPEGPKIALIVGDVGLSSRLTRIALEDLPTVTALAMSPYGSNLDETVRVARENGFELLLELPLEPFNYPNNDPGPHTLLVDTAWESNVQRLQWLLARITNYIGVMPDMGERFTAHENSVKRLMDNMHARGLAFVEPGRSLRSLSQRLAPSISNDTDGHFPFLKADLILGDIGEASFVEQRLAQLEDMARTREFATGYLPLTPGNLSVTLPWLRSLQERGITLVPLSYMIQRNTRTGQSLGRTSNQSANTGSP